MGYLATIQAGWLVNNEFKRPSEEAAVVWFEAAPYNAKTLPVGTEEILADFRAIAWTRELLNKKKQL